jgi:hypothetical protein
MNLAIVIVIAAVSALAIILRLAVSQRLQRPVGDQRANQLQLIDLDAFRNLINPAEDEYLRRRLPPAQFREVRRARLRAMAAYVQSAAGNATILLRVGEAALASGESRLTPAAEQLVNQALLLRRNTTIALLRIYVALAWPYSEFAAVRVIDRYEQLSSSAMLLGRLQHPGRAVRLSG